MRFISFLLFLVFVYPIAMLPMWALYGISNVLSFCFHKVFKYRLDVVVNNLKRSFPEKTEAEIDAITKAFYKHLADIFVETLKTFTISKRTLNNRITVKNLDLIEKFYDEGKSIIAISGHYNNWEWPAMAFDMTNRHRGIGIYKKITNPYFDRLMKWSRERHGINMIEASKVYDFFKSEKEPFIVGFLSDQWPSKIEKAYWTNFLNQETAVYIGAEKYALEYNLPVIYGTIKKVGRGRYEIQYQLITSEPRLEKPGFITETHVKLLEKSIKDSPAYWIWSHKRWKKSKAATKEQNKTPEKINQ